MSGGFLCCITKLLMIFMISIVVHTHTHTTVVPPIILISSPTEDDIVLGHVNITCTSQGNPPPTVSLYCDDLETNASYPDVLIDGDFGVVPAVVSTIGVQSDGADGLKRCHCRASAYDGNATFTAQDSVPLLPSE